MEASTRHSVWAERYDRQIEDVFAIQEEIARSIAQALRITLTPQEEQTIARKPTENLQAYDCYLRGRSYARRENMDYALQMFEQAIQLDPNFALAHAGMAYMCGMIFQVREQNPKWIERGLDACDRRARARPAGSAGGPGPHRLRAEELRREPMAAQRAIERKPDCEGSWNILGRAFFAAGRFEAARRSPSAPSRPTATTTTPMFPTCWPSKLGRKKEAESVRVRW